MLAMPSSHVDDNAPIEKRYRALLAVSEAIASHRELQGLFHDLAGRLEEVVQFDLLGVVLHDAATESMRLHVVESAAPAPRIKTTKAAIAEFVIPVENDPAGMVWRDQKTIIFSNQGELQRYSRASSSAMALTVSRTCASL